MVLLQYIYFLKDDTFVLWTRFILGDTQDDNEHGAREQPHHRGRREFELEAVAQQLVEVPRPRERVHQRLDGRLLPGFVPTRLLSMYCIARPSWCLARQS